MIKIQYNQNQICNVNIEIIQNQIKIINLRYKKHSISFSRDEMSKFHFKHNVSSDYFDSRLSNPSEREIVNHIKNDSAFLNALRKYDENVLNYFKF